MPRDSVTLLTKQRPGRTPLVVMPAMQDRQAFAHWLRALVVCFYSIRNDNELAIKIRARLPHDEKGSGNGMPVRTWQHAFACMEAYENRSPGEFYDELSRQPALARVWALAKSRDPRSGTNLPSQLSALLAETPLTPFGVDLDFLKVLQSADYLAQAVRGPTFQGSTPLQEL